MEAKVLYAQKLRSSDVNIHGLNRIKVERVDGQVFRRSVDIVLTFSPQKVTPDGYPFAEVSDTPRNRIALGNLVADTMVFLEDPEVLDWDKDKKKLTGTWAPKEVAKVEEGKIVSEKVVVETKEDDTAVLSGLQNEYSELLDRDVPKNKKNDKVWLQAKIDEALAKD